MPWLTVIFILAVIGGTALQLWLSGRQVTAVASHRARVPEPFDAQISSTEHAKAADYTIATVRFRRIETVFDAAVLLALTIGGGLDAIDTLWRRTGWSQPWLGTAGSAVALPARPIGAASRSSGMRRRPRRALRSAVRLAACPG